MTGGRDPANTSDRTPVRRPPPHIDQRILAALQVDGRASWRRIAQVLDEPERTVARRGHELLQSTAVQVRGIVNPRRAWGADQYVLRVSCAPGTVVVAAQALARRSDAFYSYMTTGPAECTAEISCVPSRLDALLGDDLGTTPGIAGVTSYPVLQYFRTIHDWDTPVLSADQVRLLRDPGAPPFPGHPSAAELTEEERVLLRALAIDGRASYEDLARLARITVPTARRRVARLRADGSLLVRAVFEPSLIGLPVEALLWARLPYSQVDTIGRELAASAHVGYAAALAGDYQLLVRLVMPSRDRLYEYLRTAEWINATSAVESAFLVRSFKRGGIFSPGTRASSLPEL